MHALLCYANNFTMIIVGLRKTITDNVKLGENPTDFIYLNDSIKIFEDEVNASVYKDYLNGTTRYSKDYESFSTEIRVYAKDELNLDELIREDAITRLTAEERRVLGL